jgi:hypothetical protein
MPPSIVFAAGDEFFAQSEGCTKAFVVAPASSLKSGLAFGALQHDTALVASLEALAAKAGEGTATGSSSSTLVIGGSGASEAAVVPLAEESSRYYSPTQSMAITAGLASAGVAGAKKASVLIVLKEEEHLLPAAMAVARACPTYSRKSTPAAETVVVVGFVHVAAPTVLLADAAKLCAAELISQSIREAAHIAETPAEDASTADVEATARAMLVGVPNVEITSIVGEDLRACGLGGIYNGAHPPLLVSPLDRQLAQRALHSQCSFRG